MHTLRSLCAGQSCAVLTRCGSRPCSLFAVGRQLRAFWRSATICIRHLVHSQPPATTTNPGMVASGEPHAHLALDFLHFVAFRVRKHPARPHLSGPPPATPRVRHIAEWLIPYPRQDEKRALLLQQDTVPLLVGLLKGGAEFELSRSALSLLARQTPCSATHRRGSPVPPRHAACLSAELLLVSSTETDLPVPGPPGSGPAGEVAWRDHARPEEPPARAGRVPRDVAQHNQAREWVERTRQPADSLVPQNALILSTCMWHRPAGSSCSLPTGGFRRCTARASCRTWRPPPLPWKVSQARRRFASSWCAVGQARLGTCVYRQCIGRSVWVHADR